MGEVLDIADYRLLSAQQTIALLIADINDAPEEEGTGHRPIALAALQVAAMAIEAMADELCWPLPYAAEIMGEALADLADSGPEDGANTIWVPAKALARAGKVGMVGDLSHPDPDFGLVSMQSARWSRTAPATTRVAPASGRHQSSGTLRPMTRRRKQ